MVAPMPLQDIEARIAAATARAGRPAGAVTLVAVSKVQPPDRVRAVLDAGQRVFGENRVQEAEDRWPPFREAVPRRPRCTSSARCRPTSSPARWRSSTRSTASTATASPASSPTRCRPAAPARRSSSRSTPAASRRRPASTPTASTPSSPPAARYDLPVFGLMAIPPVDDDPAPHFALPARPRRPPRPRRPLDGHERRLRGRDRLRRHPRPHRLGDLRLPSRQPG